MDQKEIPYDTHHLGAIRCVQIDFRAHGTFHANRAPILHEDYHYLKRDQTKLPLEPLHLGVPSGASKMVSSTMVY